MLTCGQHYANSMIPKHVCLHTLGTCHYAHILNGSTESSDNIAHAQQNS